MPKNGNGYRQWAIKQAEFKGYVTVKLREIHDDVREIKDMQQRNIDRITRLENEMTGQKLKTSIIGFISGALATGIGFITLLFRK